MRQGTIVKIILFIFFIIFFGFLFWYFYNPDGETNIGGQEGVNDIAEFPTVEKDVSIWGQTKDFFGMGGNGDDLSQEIKISGNPGNESNNSNENNGEGEVDSDIQKIDMPILRQITNFPTAGAIIQTLNDDEYGSLIINDERFRKIPDGVYSELRSVNMKNNHVYRSFDFTLDNERIINKTQPKVFNTKFLDKDHYLFQYISKKNVKTYLAKIVQKIESADGYNQEEKENNKFLLSGSFLEDNIIDFAVFPENKQIFYLINSIGGVEGYIVDYNGINKKMVFSSPLKEWNIHWLNKDIIILSTKASSVAYSLAFELNLKDGSFQQLFYKVKAGNILPNHQNTIFLYSGIFDDKFRTLLMAKVNRWTEVLDFKTFAEKCLWSNDDTILYCAVPEFIENDSLDKWYKGKINTIDSIYKLNLLTGQKEQIFSPRNEKEIFDIVDLHLDDKERYLYFRDKKTDFYWSLDLDQIEKKKQEKNKNKKQTEKKDTEQVEEQENINTDNSQPINNNTENN